MQEPSDAEPAMAWEPITPLPHPLEPSMVADLVASLATAGVRRVAVTFVNHAGSPLVKTFPLERLAVVAHQGVGFSPVADAFAVDGSVDPLHPLARPDGDLRLRPDLQALIPFDLAAGWAWAPGERFDREGGPYAADQRGFCRRALAELTALKAEVVAGFEIEWVVATAAAEPEGDAVAGWRPALLGGPYGADRLVDGLDYVSALAEALEAAGLPWLQIHPEYGLGQMELSLAPADPLSAADRLVAARLLIQRVTARFGWRCSFSPLVTPDRVGNGGHVHLSLSRDGLPLWQGGDGVAGLTAPGAGVLGALLEQLPALLPLACPLALSYRRLGPGRWSAPFQAWGVENRETALRLIPTAGDGAPAHLELKVADLAANPYLLLGGLLAVVADGLQRPRPLAAPVQGDPAALGVAAPPRLPASLEEASRAFATSSVLRDALGDLLHSTVLETQRAEHRRAAHLDPDQLLLQSRWSPG